MAKLAASLLLASGTVACESAWTLNLTVRISAHRQAQYKDYPAQVVLVTDPSAQAIIEGADGHAARIANLCSAKSSDFLVNLQLRGDDCTDLPRYVQAWLEPREEGAESKCGPFDEPSPLIGLRHPPPDGLQADATVFDNYKGSCDGLHTSVTLNLDG